MAGVLIHDTMGRVRVADVNPWFVLVGSGAAIAWLLPNHSPPWPSFFNESLIGWALLALAGGVALRSNELALPRSALFVLALACVPALQFLFGQIRFGGDALLAVLYLVGLALCIVTGSCWRRAAHHSVTLSVALWFVTVALLSLGLALAQWLRVDHLGVLLADLPRDARPTGNIAQANHFATLMVWGLIGVWLLYEHGKLRNAIAACAAVCMLFGTAMSQSRTGWAHVGLLLLAAWMLYRRRGVRLHPLAASLLAAGFALLVLVWASLNQALLLTPSLTLEQLAQGGSRIEIWRVAAQAIVAQPWVGYGWTQIGLAQQAVALSAPGANVLFSDAHNLALDLLLWNGVPLGSLVLLALATWLFNRLRRTNSTDSALFMLVLLTLLLHAQFEFPLSYAYFLLPAGLVVGIVEVDTGASARWTMHRSLWWSALAACGVLLATITAEYLAIEEGLTRYRFEAARVGSMRGSQPPPTVLLTQLGALMRFAHSNPREVLDDRQLSELRNVVERFPSAGNQYRLALLLAHNEQPAQAQRVLQTLCAVQRKFACERAADAWEAARQDEAKLPPFVRRDDHSN